MSVFALALTQFPSMVFTQCGERKGAADLNEAKLKDCSLYPAQFIHLTHNGVLVNEGDRVKQGQVIALSGNTGDTGGGAHLHLDVQQCGPNLPPNYNQLPCGQTLPIVFRNTRPHACGLVSNERYRAEKLR